MNQARDTPPALTVLYDGSCPLCRRGVMELAYRIFAFPPEVAAMGVALRLTLANRVIGFTLEDMPAICL
jgi:hypothetical protein